MKKILFLFLVSFFCFLQYGFTAEFSPEEYVLSQLKIASYPASKLDTYSINLQYSVGGKNIGEVVNYYKDSLSAKGWKCEVKHFDEEFLRTFAQLKKSIAEANKRGAALPQNMDKKTAESFASLSDAYVRTQVKLYAPIIIEAKNNINNSVCTITLRSLSETIVMVNVVLRKTL